MKSIVRRDTGEDWQAYVTGLMRDAGKVGPDEKPTIEEMKTVRQSPPGQEGLGTRIGKVRLIPTAASRR